MGMDLTAFKGKGPAQSFAVLNPQDDGLADGIGSSYAIIGYKGKNWTLRYHGEKKLFARPDDNSPMNYIDVIILRAAHQKSKSYYAAYDQNASEGQRPICASLDGVVPDADVQQKQADACALCPRNVWRTNAAGRRERDCNDYKRLAVLVLPSQTTRMFGQPIMEPAFLRVPPGSLNSLVTMSDAMKAQGFHSATYITRISFDVNEAAPSMIFTPLQPLSDAEAPVVLPLVSDELAKRITGEDVVSSQRKAPAIAAPSAAPQITAQPQPVSAASLVAQAAPQAAQVQQPAQPTQPVPAVVTQPQVQVLATQPTPPLATVDTGLLAVAEANPSVLNPSPTPKPTAQPAVIQTAADVGEPQESDAAMDERIAGILGKV